MTRDNWIFHTHLGKRGVPVTVYRGSSPGTYDLLHGSKSYIYLNREECALMLGRILLGLMPVKPRRNPPMARGSLV
jgi:hypothetical protein